jgi:cell volume regulation protein A
LGGAIGFLMGKGSVWLINNIKLETEGLYPVLTLGLAMFTYSVTHAIGGNGFLAIYLSAVIIGNSKMVHRRSLIKFYDGQAWIMQIILFLTLGLLVFPSKVYPLIGMGLLISAFLIFVARPFGVFISLSFFKSNLRSKLFVSWVGLRGGVPIVFATYPLIAGVPGADLIFNLVFFISISSVLLQGTTLTWVARMLHVDLPPKTKRKHEVETGDAERISTEMQEIIVPANSVASGKRIVELGIPSGINIMAIRRGDIYITPVGSTGIEPGDTLFVMIQNKNALAQFENILAN